MKILLVLDSLRRGGKERQLCELLKGMKKYDNIKFYILVRRRIIEYKELYNLGYEIFYPQTPSKWKFVFYLNKTIMKKRIWPWILVLATVLLSAATEDLFLRLPLRFLQEERESIHLAKEDIDLFINGQPTKIFELKKKTKSLLISVLATERSNLTEKTPCR